MVHFKYKLWMHIQIFDKLCLEQLHECSFSMSTNKRKLDKENSKHHAAFRFYQNSFGQALSHVTLGLVEGRQEPNTCYWVAG